MTLALFAKQPLLLGLPTVQGWQRLVPNLVIQRDSCMDPFMRGPLSMGPRRAQPKRGRSRLAGAGVHNGKDHRQGLTAAVCSRQCKFLPRRDRMPWKMPVAPAASVYGRVSVLYTTLSPCAMLQERRHSALRHSQGHCWERIRPFMGEEQLLRENAG